MRDIVATEHTEAIVVTDRNGRVLDAQARRELPAERFLPLGQPFFPSPGILTERIHVVDVDAAREGRAMQADVIAAIVGAVLPE